MTGELRSAQLEVGDAHDAIETFFERGWTDGLPIVPPTPALVRAFLDAARVSPDEVLGRIPTRDDLDITAEKLAINAVMAGAKAEYMPLIVAAMRALCDPEHILHVHTATLSGAVQVLIVNGPIRERLGINFQEGAFGPGWRANATIGRALRLALRNVARSVHGEFDRAAFSHPGRFGWCFGEDEGESDWPTLAMEQGLAAGQDAVTAYASNWQSVVQSDARDAKDLLDEIGDGVRWAYYTGWRRMCREKELNYNASYERRKFLLVMGSEHLRVLHAAGMDKRTVQQELFRRLTDEREIPPLAIAGAHNVWIARVRAAAMPWTWFFLPCHMSTPITLPVGG